MSLEDEAKDLLVKKLSKNDALPLIYLSACIVLYIYLAPVLGSLPNKAFPEPFDVFLRVIPLASILLIIVSTTLIIILNLISKFLKKDKEKD